MISFNTILLYLILLVSYTIRNYAELLLLTPGFGNNNNDNNNLGSIQFDHSEDITRIGGTLLVENLELKLGEGNIHLGTSLNYKIGSTNWGFHGSNDRLGLMMNDKLIFQIINDGVTMFHLLGDASFNDVILNEKHSKEIQLSLCILDMMVNDRNMNEQNANRVYTIININTNINTDNTTYININTNTFINTNTKYQY